MESLQNAIHCTDCVTGMRELPAGSIDLAFADPPFNIGYEYDQYDDRREADEYLDWSRKWISEVIRVLKPDGTFWLAIGDEYAAELKVMMTRELGLTCRSWVVWYYTFGVNCKYKFSRSHAHLFHMVKDPERFTFNADDPAIRIPSARQLVYGDKRANPKGRLPDDTWMIPPVGGGEPRGERGESKARSQESGVRSQEPLNTHHSRPSDFVLRPQDIPESFQPHEDTWYFPRVNGTFKERAGWHGCQMPERLLGRIILACSNPEELVLDPFAGSGTTLAVAKKLGRQFLGYELSKQYAEHAQKRIDEAQKGQPLDGVDNPLTSVPSTENGKRLEVRQPHAQRVSTNRRTKPRSDRSISDTVIAAFERVHNGFSTDYVLANPELNAAFVDACRKLGNAAKPADWNKALIRIRKSGKLGKHATRRFRISTKDLDTFVFASEIAARKLGDVGHSLDDVLCDPELAAAFDRIAQDFAPGFGSLEYRWGALHVRKMYRRRMKHVANVPESIKRRRGTRAKAIESLDFGTLPERPGIYILSAEENATLYIGKTASLHSRLTCQFDKGTVSTWENLSNSLFLSIIDGVDNSSEQYGLQGFLIANRRPQLNYWPDSNKAA